MEKKYYFLLKNGAVVGCKEYEEAYSDSLSTTSTVSTAYKCIDVRIGSIRMDELTILKTEISGFGVKEIDKNGSTVWEG